MASGQRGANGQPGGSAASDGGAPGIGTRPGAHSVTSQTAGQFDVHLAGNGEATFTAPTQPGEYAFYCTYHPSMKGTLMSSSQPSGGARDPPHADCRVMPSATPMRAQDNPRSRSSRTRSRSPASIFVADVDGIRSSSSLSHIKAHSGSDGGSAGTAWSRTARVIDADACPAMSVATPTWGRTPTSRRPRRTQPRNQRRQRQAIIEHKQHMRERFPDTALADLALLP